jgi:hypothetical protein
MEKRLEELALKLKECVMKGNRLSLEHVLESARILEEARQLAGRGFETWVRDKAHMDPTTARRHLRVAAFVRAHRELTPEFTTLGLAKIYALSTLDFDTARRILSNQERFSAPLDRMTDLQFKQEFRQKYSRAPRRRTPRHVFLHALSLLKKAEDAVKEAHDPARHLGPEQRLRLVRHVEGLVRIVSDWRAKGYREAT